MKSILILFSVSVLSTFAAESEADLTLRLPPGQNVKYHWSTQTVSESSGRELGKPFTIKSESSIDMNVIFVGKPRKGEGLRMGLKIDQYAYKDKKSLGEEYGEVEASKGHIKAVNNGKVIVDSNNDVGLEEIKNYQGMLKQMSDGEMRTTIDPAGKPVGDPEGDFLVVDTIKGAGVDGILRVLPGRTLRPGESWEDSQNLPAIGVFKLAKPAVVRSKATFTGWEDKGGKHVAKIEIVSKWDTADLKGDNEDGLLVEITRVQGSSTGLCYFDPENGQFLDGQFDATSRYRIDGTKDGQSTGLDVTGKTSFKFKRVD